MPDVEGIGELATGVALARTLEPQTGIADGHTHESQCLNCGAPLSGPYCSRCGQRGHVHRTLVAWWHDFTHSVLHVDGKFWLTIGMLVWRPGELTRRYARGERAKFVSPMALFLFTVFLMFAVFSFALPKLSDMTGFNQQLQGETSKLETSIDRLERDRSLAVASGKTTAAIDKRLNDAREDLAGLRKIQSDGMIVTSGSPEDGPVRIDVEGGPSVLRTFDAAYRKAKENPSLLLYKLQANAYKFSWALIPISVPFIMILFLHRRRYRQDITAYDHFVFVTYSIAFMSLVLVAFVLLNRTIIPDGILVAALTLVPALHMYRQVRGAYVLSRWSAAWRTAALLIFAVVSLVLFALLLLVIGVAG